MFNLDEFLGISILPEKDHDGWIQDAPSGVDYLVGNSRSDDIIIFTNVGCAYAHSILVPLAGITPSAIRSLKAASFGPDDHWALAYTSSDGLGRYDLAPPIDPYNCDSLIGAEQLVFRRRFYGVDKGDFRTELSQQLVQALDLYWLDEEGAYCKLDEEGDVQKIIQLYDLSKPVGQSSATLVTIKAAFLHRYMAITDTALVTRFDFTRYMPGGCVYWGNNNKSCISENDLLYHQCIQGDGSFVNGVMISRPIFTKDALIAEEGRKWRDEDKEYAEFIAHDWRNDRIEKISCAPSALASYFDQDSSLPYQTTPAFFRSEVLQRYKADRDKYRMEQRSISSRAGWYLKSYDINEAGQVHAYLYDLAKLPYKEQLYWLSFNEPPKSAISERAYQTDFLGEFSKIPDPLFDLKYEISLIDKNKPDYWNPRGEELARAVQYPVTASIDEWSRAIHLLDQLVVEGFVVGALRQRISDRGYTFEPKWGSIRLLQQVLIAFNLEEEFAKEIVAPIKDLHELRSKVSGHFSKNKKDHIVQSAKKEHGTLPQHFRALVQRILDSFGEIVQIL